MTPHNRQPASPASHLAWLLAPVVAALLAGLLLRVLAGVFTGAQERELGPASLARLGFLLFGLVWLASACLLPILTASGALGAAARRYALWLVAAALIVPLGALYGLLGPFAVAALCMAVGLCALCAVGRFVAGLTGSRVAGGLTASIVGLALAGQIFWMNPFIDSLPGGAEGARGPRERFIAGALYAGPLGALASPFGAADVRAFESAHFSYHVSLLSKVRFDYPDWRLWCLVHAGAAIALTAAAEAIRRQRAHWDRRVSARPFIKKRHTAVAHIER